MGRCTEHQLERRSLRVLWPVTTAARRRMGASRRAARTGTSECSSLSAWALPPSVMGADKRAGRRINNSGRRPVDRYIRQRQQWHTEGSTGTSLRQQALQTRSAESAPTRTGIRVTSAWAPAGRISGIDGRPRQPHIPISSTQAASGHLAGGHLMRPGGTGGSPRNGDMRKTFFPRSSAD